MPDQLTDLKCDIRAKQEEAVFSTEVNLRDTLQFITSEYHVIPSVSPYRIRLDEVPDKDSGLTVPGYTESQSLPSQQGQFFVDWVLGYVWFHSSDNGKVVNPRYWGKGSLIDANDINKMTQELTYARNITQRLRPSAQSTPDRSIKIDSGTFLIGQTEVTYLGNNNIRLGPAGENEVKAITLTYYNKILFAITNTGLLKKYEGTEGNTPSAVTLPTIPVGEMPVCIVIVQDDGTGTAGTIKNIQSGDVKDIRPFLQVPRKEYRYLTAYIEGQPVLNEIFFDGFYFNESVTIDKISIHARSAPKGSNLTFDLVKNGSSQGRTATLTQDTTAEVTTVTALSLASIDKLGIKCTAVDSQSQAEGVSVILHYYPNA